MTSAALCPVSLQNKAPFIIQIVSLSLKFYIASLYARKPTLSVQILKVFFVPEIQQILNIKSCRKTRAVVVNNNFPEE
jgi:hypothetical protein